MVVNFSIERSILVGWMSAIGKSLVFSGQLHDIFKCVVVSFDVSNGLQLLAADGTSYVHIKNISFVEKEVSEFKFALYVEDFLAVLNASSKKIVKLEIDDNFIIVRAEGRHKIPVIDHNDFPDFPDTSACDFKSLGDSGFIPTMDKLSPFAAKDFSRPELAGVSIATDTYVATVGTHGVVHPRNEGIFEPITISPSSLKFLNSLHKESLEDVWFGYLPSIFVFVSPDFTFIGGLPVTNFPFEHLKTILSLKETSEFKVIIVKNILFSAIRRVMILSKDKFTNLKVNISNKVLKLDCQGEQSSSFSSEELSPFTIVNTNSSSEDVDVSFMLSTQSVSDFTRLFGDGEGNIEIYYGGDKVPILIIEDGNKFEFFTTTLRNH